MSKFEFTIDLEKNTPIEYLIGKVKLHGKVIDVKNVKETGTTQQSKAIHLWLNQIAKDCVSKGITMKMILEKQMEIMPTGILLKESLWKFIQKKMFDKESTTQLSKSGEIDSIIDVITLHFSELGAEVPPFPSDEFYR